MDPDLFSISLWLFGGVLLVLVSRALYGFVRGFIEGYRGPTLERVSGLSSNSSKPKGETSATWRDPTDDRPSVLRPSKSSTRQFVLSYSRTSLSAVQKMAEDIREMGHNVWFDQDLSGGQRWWDTILSNIRESEVFLFALTPAALESAACQREYRYADQLRKPILPVLVSDVSEQLFPPELSKIQHVDYRQRNVDAAIRLSGALNRLPAAPPLPSPLPPPPELPISYLAQLRQQIEAPRDLTKAEQSELLLDLTKVFYDSATVAEARYLLESMRKRPDLLADVRDAIDRYLTGP